MDVYFPDGKPFHRMSFRDHANQDTHWCDPDDYKVNYLWGGRMPSATPGTCTDQPRTCCSNPG
ncbi:conserved hypothetical protein [Arthrobacter sp. Hiyo8]|nr:conserved hypothetical protein [Arthrobacter sp. Hiyo8]